MKQNKAKESQHIVTFTITHFRQ